MKLRKVKTILISIANKLLMEIKLSFSCYSIFIVANPPIWTLEKKSGQSGEGNV